MEEKIREGNSDYITRKYFDSLAIEMRHIDAVKPNLRFELFGEVFDSPIMGAALSHINLCGENGMVELAKGMEKANAVMWAGMGDEIELKQIIETGAKTIKIIKPYEDRQLILKKMERARALGALAVGIDIDHAFAGNGESDVILNHPMKGISMDELKGFVSTAQLPFIVKGVLSVQDAEKSLQAGAAGIVVSHHHGIMDFAVPPLKVLPDIVEVVSGKMKVFVDCGIESGFDAYKALALGADGVSIGRPLLKPLQETGAKGACSYIKSIIGELAGIMSRTCIADVEHFSSKVLHKMV